MSSQQPIYISEVFYDDRGWKRHPLNKRVSKSELQRLRHNGASTMSLLIEGHSVDFSIKELVNS